MNLTPDNKRVLRYVQNYIDKNEYAPTFKEMSESLDRAHGTIHEHLENLKKAGYIEREYNRNRSIKVLKRVNEK